MTIIMQCLGCGTTVENPRTINYMYEKCSPCADKQKDMEGLAIDAYLHGEAERKLDSNG